MPVIAQIAFALVAFMASAIGSLMLFAPNRYPKLYKGVLRENVMRRQHTEKDRTKAIRPQGLIGIACGAFFGLFVWALR
jgi:hypothetical protein